MIEAPSVGAFAMYPGSVEEHLPTAGRGEKKSPGRCPLTEASLRTVIKLSMGIAVPALGVCVGRDTGSSGCQPVTGDRPSQPFIPLGE